MTQWKAIDGFLGYEVSDRGDVRSGRGLLRGEKSFDGYIRFTLYRNRIPIRRFGHRLVLEAFVGQCPDGKQCAHNNGVRDDNRLENLRWDTISGNHSDKWRHGTAQAGENHALHKLTDYFVRLIRSDVRSSIELAKEIPIDASTIRKIRRRVLWAHIA